MGMHRLTLSEPDLTLFLLDDCSVMHSASRQTLYGLDTAATVQLLRDAEAGASLSEALLPVQPPLPAAGGPSPWLPLPAAPSTNSQGPIYQICGRRFLLREGFAEDAAWRGLLAPLIDGGGEPVDMVVDAIPCGEGWQLQFNGAALDGPVQEEELFPHLLGRLRVLAYQGRDFLLAIHAAVLAREERGVLLPGGSGVGKSTLSLGLMASGYQLLSDELALIDASSQRALPAPTAVAVKAGSWAHLAPLYPELNNAETYRRWDGQPVRYVVPEPAQLAATPCTVDAIVFPRYVPGAELTLTRLDPLAALQGICAAGYQLKDGLDVTRTESLLSWLYARPVFALQYGNLTQAMEGIAQCIG